MILDFFYLFLYYLFKGLTYLIPIQYINKGLYQLATLLYHRTQKYQNIISKNLKLAFSPPLTKEKEKKIGIHVFYNLLQVIVQIIRRERETKEEILSHITFENEHYLTTAIQNNEPIIFVTGHYSNWELLPLAISAHYHLPLVGVGRKLDSKIMDKILIKNRERFGVEMLYRKGAMKGLMKALKQGKSVGLLLDQHLGKKQGGIEVSFFKHKVLHSPAASILARTFQAKMIPAYISTTDYIHYTVTFHPPILPLKTEDKTLDIQTMTQAQAQSMEDVIRKRPHEWFWVHKRWKAFYPEIYTKRKQ